MAPKSILIVDDDALARECVADVIRHERPGVEVREATDGDEGLAAMAERAPDLVVLDLLMPNKSGVETLQEVRRRFPAVKVIVISSLDSDSMRARVMEEGAAEFVGKPFHPLEIAAAIQRHLGG